MFTVIKTQFMTFEEKMSRVQRYYNVNGVIPTFEEMIALFGATSKNTAFKFMKKAEEEKYFRRLPVTRFAPMDRFFL